MVEGATLLQEGARVRLQRGNLSADCEIAWCNGGLRGVRFDDPVDVVAWVSRRDLTAKKELQGIDPESIAQLADELVRVCDRISLLPDIANEVRDKIDEIRSISSSLKVSDGKP